MTETAGRETHMPTSVRVAVVLTVLGVWTIVVISYLIKGQLPDAVLLGVPAAVILAAAPFPNGKRLPGRKPPPTEDSGDPQ